MIVENTSDILPSKSSIQNSNSNLLMKEAMIYINTLKDAGVDKYFNIPTIAVIGIQSSGKSSVLEGLIGLDILPRSDGLCTRTPIELRMFNTESEEYAIIHEISSPSDVIETQRKVTDFNELKKIIIKQTDIKAGTKKNIVDRPITITIYSPKCPDLTVVDLPGIVNIALENTDQPKDIDEITWNISQKYCKKEETIMLCVLASGVDITTSQILKYAKSIDPEGKRTMGVLTKVDLMNEGTSIEDALLGKQVKLGLGLVAVRNRTQKELDTISLEEALEKERQFFSSHTIYSKMTDNWGTTTLLNKVSKALYNLVNKGKKQMMESINKLSSELQKEYNDLGNGVPESEKERRTIVLDLIDKFSYEFKNVMEGRNLEKKKIVVGGFLIKETYGDFLIEIADSNYKVSDTLSDEEILDKIRKLYGDTFDFNYSVHAYNHLLKPLIDNLINPTISYIHQIEDTIISICYHYIESHFNKYFRLELKFKEYAQVYISNKVKECKDYVINTFKILKRPFSNNRHYHEAIEEFISNKLNSKNAFKYEIESSLQTSQLTLDNEIKSVKKLKIVPLNYDNLKEIRMRIDEYYKNAIILKLRDMVPGCINTVLVHELSNKINTYFIQQMEVDSELLQLLDEDDEIKSLRSQIKSQLVKLKNLKAMLLNSRQTQSS